MGERVRGDLHVQTVNSRHSRLKDFLRPRRGIATRYLDNYLSWFHLVGLAPGANKANQNIIVVVSVGAVAYALTAMLRACYLLQHHGPTRP